MSRRLTKDVVQEILDQNEGFTGTTSFSSRNSSYTNKYRIENGSMLVHSEGKGGYGVGRYEEDYECDIDQVRRAIKHFGLNE